MKISTTSNDIFSKLIIAAVWIGIWQLAAIVINKEILIVSPFEVVKTLVHLASEFSFWQTISLSLIRIMEGWILAVVLGIAIAVIVYIIPLAYNFFYPIISIMKATPVASFIILALVWIKTGYVSVFASFVMVFPVVWGSIYEGIKNTDKELLEMSHVYNFSEVKKVKLIYIPSVMPYFISSCTTGIGLAWKSGIAAEVISTPEFSIGKQLNNSKVYLETPELFAWTVVIILLSVVIEKIFVRLINTIGNKYNV